MDGVKAFSWANSPSMDIPFSDKAMALRAAPNGYPAVLISEVQMDDRVIGYCFQQNQREEVRMDKVAYALCAESGMHQTKIQVQPFLERGGATTMCRL